MMYSNDSLAKLYFDIYNEVMQENADSSWKIDREQLTAVTTTIFIAVTQNRGFKKPAFFSKFQTEVLRLVGKIKDRSLQESVYKSIKVMIKEKL